MKLYALTVLLKVAGVKPKKLSATYDLSSFGFFQRSRWFERHCLIQYDEKILTCTQKLVASEAAPLGMVIHTVHVRQHTLLLDSFIQFHCHNTLFWCNFHVPKGTKFKIFLAGGYGAHCLSLRISPPLSALHASHSAYPQSHILFRLGLRLAKTEK